MGYTTDFEGRFKFDKPLTAEQVSKLNEFADERHGGNTEVYEDYPGFWCSWRPDENGNYLEWDGSEKFYNYIEWLQLIIDRFLESWNVKLNGSVKWRGEDSDDRGLIVVTDNKIEVREGITVYQDDTSETRVFFVVDGPEIDEQDSQNEELFETLETAEKYAETVLSPRVRVCLVRNAYRENDGTWNYDDQSDTFETIKVISEV